MAETGGGDRGRGSDRGQRRRRGIGSQRSRESPREVLGQPVELREEGERRTEEKAAHQMKCIHLVGSFFCKRSKSRYNRTCLRRPQLYAQIVSNNNICAMSDHLPKATNDHHINIILTCYERPEHANSRNLMGKKARLVLSLCTNLHHFVVVWYTLLIINV